MNYLGIKPLSKIRGKNEHSNKVYKNTANEKRSF